MNNLDIRINTNDNFDNQTQNNNQDNSLDNVDTEISNISNKFINLGWYPKDKILKNCIFQRGGKIECYSCSKNVKYSDVLLSRTIPIHIMPKSKDTNKKVENIFVICGNCAMEEYFCIEAPKNYNMILNHYQKKNKWLNTRQLVNDDLVKKMEKLKQEESTLKVEIMEKTTILNKLRQDTIELRNNIELEKDKQSVFNNYKHENQKIMDEIYQEKKKVKFFVEKQFRSTSKYINKTYDTLFKKYNEFIDKTTLDVEQLELLDTMEDSRSAPCQICSIYKINTTLPNCGHCLCDKCIKKLPEKKCPFCKTEFTNTVKLFLGF